MTYPDFLDRLNLSHGDAQLLMDGRLEIDEMIAGRLERSLGATAEFWLGREAQYRKDLEREVNRLESESFDWMASLPLADMVKRRWIPSYLKGQEKLDACLQYFGVESYPAWKNKYEGLLHSVAFRTSATYDPTLESVLTWLRQGEVQALASQAYSWDRHRFMDALTSARELTLVKDPQDFLPSLRELFLPCGVSIAVAPTPRGCSASGAVFFVKPKHAVILLSFRYLSDDHFWFTFFHECGHLALHEDSGIFLEGKFAVGREEDEANQFAESFLIPAEHRDEFGRLSIKNVRAIYKFARKIGVSPGIVVGQLQHAGIVDNRHLNGAKVRYRWNKGES